MAMVCHGFYLTSLLQFLRGDTGELVQQQQNGLDTAASLGFPPKNYHFPTNITCHCHFRPFGPCLLLYPRPLMPTSTTVKTTTTMALRRLQRCAPLTWRSARVWERARQRDVPGNQRDQARRHPPPTLLLSPKLKPLLLPLPRYHPHYHPLPRPHCLARGVFAAASYTSIQTIPAAVGAVRRARTHLAIPAPWITTTVAWTKVNIHPCTITSPLPTLSLLSLAPPTSTYISPTMP